MINKLKKIFAISRPISWVNTAFPFGAAYLVSGGDLDAIFWVGVVFFLIPYNVLMYGINDVFDYESDMQNPRKGGLEGAKEQKSLHPFIIKSSIITCVPFVVFLLMTGTWLSGITLIALLFFVVAYSIKGLRFKEIPILDSITSSIHFVGPMLYALASTSYKPGFIPYIIAFFLWGMASHAFGAVQDILPDRKGGIASIATIFGARLTTWITLALYAVVCAILFAQGGYAVAIGVTGLLYVLNVAQFLRITDKTSGETNKGWRRFIWLNLVAGAIVTIVLILSSGKVLA